MKNKLWIVSFQCLSGDKESREDLEIRCMATCAAAKDIRGALDNAEYLIKRYLRNENMGDRYVITDVGIAAEDSRELLDLFWIESYADPDRNLFS